MATTAREAETWDVMEARMGRIEELLRSLVEREAVQDWYSTVQVARGLGKSEVTVREWCRRGRVRARKQVNGRGKFAGWSVAHEELVRFGREGLLPDLALGRPSG
ncbi:helix-turn-helix domain-containing protein [Paludisphaera mucosa]|uniref:Helix-turn-helix domain-containing protein n=1 Tax=Paludisphaera mucosa TaxID=3030827 RepID=A0ABT6FB54_9BACT|nr:helix-turn-helix domain-containing protein [Paludisphaera mucosa]MDG3004757.1 helix-turn-helix domain-containing protein [Paludisphaera mucosa]